MSLFLIILFIVLALAGVLFLGLYHKASKERQALAKVNKELTAECNRRGELIRKLQEVENEAEKLKTKINSGSDSERFNGSLDVLSELAKESRPGEG